MSNILFVTSSPNGANSNSTKVAEALVETLKARKPGATVTRRDLAQAPLPHIDAGFLTGQPDAAARVDVAVKELLAADTLVIASAMINFGPSSTLKSWIDHIVRAGVTFQYGASGAEGLVKGKKAYIVVARGGVYSDGPMQAYDFQAPYLKTVLGFIGITDVEVIAVEGVAFGPEAAAKALDAALAQARAA